MMLLPNFTTACMAALERFNGDGVGARIARTLFWGACFVVSVKLCRWIP